MESGRGHGGVMRGGPGGKKMRKRKELDALVGGVGVKRGNGGSKRPGSGGVSPQDQLLSESTGEEDYWSSAKGGGGGKGRKPYRTSHGKRRTHACTALLRLCTILLVMACVVATITVMWLFIDIKEQTTYLRSQLDQVLAGSKGIPESLQGYHTLTRELEKNQSTLAEDLLRVALKLSNFTNIVNSMKSDLLRLEKTIDESSPSRLNDPNTLQTLTTTVASFKDQIEELEAKSASISEEQVQMRTFITYMNSNISFILKEIKEMRKLSHSGQANEDITYFDQEQIKPDISQLNQSMQDTVKQLNDDIKRVQVFTSRLSDEIALVRSILKTLRGDISKQNDTMSKWQLDLNNRTSHMDSLVKHSEALQFNITNLVTGVISTEMPNSAANIVNDTVT